MDAVIPTRGQQNTAPVITVRGETTQAVSLCLDAARDKLTSGQEIWLDLGAADTFYDDSALYISELMAFHRRALSVGALPIYFNLTPRLEQKFEMLCIDRIFRIHPSKRKRVYDSVREMAPIQSQGMTEPEFLVRELIRGCALHLRGQRGQCENHSRARFALILKM